MNGMVGQRDSGRVAWAIAPEPKANPSHSRPTRRKTDDNMIMGKPGLKT
jgi:hypothetical protein